MKYFLESILQSIKNFFGIKPRLSESQNLTQDDAFNAIKLRKEKELNRILDKINRKGMNGLTVREKQFLKEQSGN